MTLKDRENACEVDTVPPFRAPRSAFRAPWTVGLVVLSGLATAVFLGFEQGGWLVCTPQRLAAGELWRLLVGPLVHASWEHAVRDLGLLAVLGLIYEPRVGRRFGPVLLAATAVAPLAAFATSDAMVAYFGMSSTVHGAAAAALVQEWRSARGRPPLWIVGVSLLLPVCLLLELCAGPLVFHLDLGRHVRSVPLTHLAGFAAGAVCMMRWRDVPHGASAAIGEEVRR